MTVIFSSAAKAPVAESGFSLMELLVVLSIIAIIAAIATRGALRPDPMAAQRDRLAIRQQIEQTRSKALMTGRSVELKREDLPKGTSIQSLNGARLLWFADGSAHPATISRSGSALVSIDPVTGLATDAR